MGKSNCNMFLDVFKEPWTLIKMRRRSGLLITKLSS